MLFGMSMIVVGWLILVLINLELNLFIMILLVVLIEGGNVFVMMFVVILGVNLLFDELILYGIVVIMMVC